MTSDHYHIYRLCRYGQGQLTLVTLIAKGQSQGHKGQWRFLADLYVFDKKLLYAEFKFVVIYYGSFMSRNGLSFDIAHRAISTV